MVKKILLVAMAAILGTSTASAERLNRNVEAGTYGKITGTYFDEADEYKYEESHINGYMAYHFNKSTKIKADVGVRSVIDVNGEYDSDVYLDELYYKFTENQTSSLILGRFFNPIGLNGTSTRNYKEHPFTVSPNTISSIDGLGLKYLGKLQKNVYFDLDVFVGTTLTDSKIDGLEIDFDPQLNYGVNVEIAGAAGNINFGLYSSSNEEDLKVNDIKLTDERSYFYQSNVGYEFSRNNFYFLAEYNHYELNYDDDIEHKKDTFDTYLSFKIGNAMPMIGYGYENNKGMFSSTSEEYSIDKARAGLKYVFNDDLSMLTEYNYIMPSEDDMEEDHVVSLGFTFNY